MTTRVTPEKAEIAPSRRISGVWAIPLLALAMGAYMVIHTWMSEGPEIEIAFTTAEGLEQGKTQIKYRNVDMGVVEKVRLNENFDGVIATAKLDRQALPLLREDTSFWVVTARVGISNISGLDTLLSGAYIQLAPGTGKPGQVHFTALEQPPTTPQGAPGLRLQLTSDQASSVGTGDPVLFKGYPVGRVESTEFDPDSRVVRYAIFIDAPYHELVNSAVRFWDISGISLDASAEGMRLEMGALDTVLLGGVSFGVPEGVAAGEAVAHNTEFELYASYDDIRENPFLYGTYYVAYFQSVKGLLPGAPVEFRGITIGRVERLLLKESAQAQIHGHDGGKGLPIPVLVYVEPARMELPDQQDSIDLLSQSVAIGVKNGLRASLETGNLLTGAKYINLDYYPDAPDEGLGKFLDYTTIPSIDTGLGQMQQQVSLILDKIAKLPLDRTVSEVNVAVAELNATLASLNTLLAQSSTRELPQELNATLADLRKSLDALAPQSELYQGINSSLLRLNNTLGNLDQLTRTLAAQPSAVVLPAPATPDPLPEIKQ